MDLIKKFFLFIAQPIVLSLLLTSISVLLIPPISKYKLNFIKSTPITTNDKIFYDDFNHDGNCELVYYHHRFDSIHQSYVVRNNDVIVDQWHFEGDKLNGNSINTGDFNNDNSDEIYQVIRKNDSVFLIYIEPFKADGNIDSKFLFEDNNPVKDLHVCSIILRDLNRDGFKEIVFTITVGYSVYPRAIYAYDRFNDELIKTPNLCFALLDTFVDDIDDDGIPEVYCYGGAYSNCDDTAAYSDHYSWLMVFNNKLEFLFEPVELGISPANLSVKPFKQGEIPYLLCYNGYNGYDENPSLQLFDLKGKLFKKRELTDRANFTSAVLFSFDQKSIFISASNGNTFEINEELNLKFIKELKPVRAYPIIKDIDTDSEPECLIFSKDYNGLTITRKGLKHPVYADLRLPSHDDFFSLNYQKGKPTQLVFSTISDVQFFEYFENFLFKIRLLIYLGIFICFIFGIKLIDWRQKYRLIQKQNAEKQMAELHLKSLKSQIDPHFALNIINTIGALYSKNQGEKADYLFDRYNMLLKQSILTANKVFISLGEEIEFVQNYLELEKSRLQNGLVYNIDFGKDVNRSLEIPKMLIYTFVENSIKHGIRHLDNPGRINIEIEDGKKWYVINIRDNGIGRERAKGMVSFGAKMGLQILDQVLEYYHKLKKISITYKITDLYHEDNPAGTLIKIRIPLGKF
ncbi:MAG: histidine kinase [Bacteroidetes bacterium]|nr:histidine kinase [Bacteroidota bacterium]